MTDLSEKAIAELALLAKSFKHIGEYPEIQIQMNDNALYAPPVYTPEQEKIFANITAGKVVQDDLKGMQNIPINQMDKWQAGGGVGPCVPYGIGAPGEPLAEMIGIPIFEEEAQEYLNDKVFKELLKNARVSFVRAFSGDTQAVQLNKMSTDSLMSKMKLQDGAKDLPVFIQPNDAEKTSLEAAALCTEIADSTFDYEALSLTKESVELMRRHITIVVDEYWERIKTVLGSEKASDNAVFTKFFADLGDSAVLNNLRAMIANKEICPSKLAVSFTPLMIDIYQPFIKTVKTKKEGEKVSLEIPSSSERDVKSTVIRRFLDQVNSRADERDGAALILAYHFLDYTARIEAQMNAPGTKVTSSGTVVPQPKTDELTPDGKHLKVKPTEDDD